MQMMMDKRRRRRESHNAVERRRRENINERIQELGTLLPEMMAETNANNKPNKGAILRHSVDHIRHLQHEVHSYSNRVKELEATLAKLQSK
ncbi:Myc-type, basic helix-loop-helix domain-containing protein [Absidia repens]|uniref:Myc-type, basic helix-loop-helix domain-containing protein n=1 Tax=Absidia repens TaxID=90262 RepID=A0A1X2IG14_9FUNG|nr:Myc-type, basic helix-loop-helix domain-containing protein [Absidia repens]